MEVSEIQREISRALQDIQTREQQMESDLKQLRNTAEMLKTIRTLLEAPKQQTHLHPVPSESL